MTMKKILAFLLAAMMLLSLTACGGSNKKNIVGMLLFFQLCKYKSIFQIYFLEEICFCLQISLKSSTFAA